MDETYTTGKYGADKITLLGLFVAGLVIAHFITYSTYTGPAKAGRQVVAEIKRKGISTFLEKQGGQSFFLIKNNLTDRTIGFTMDVRVDLATEAKLNIQSAGFLYTRGTFSQERLTLFKSDSSFDEFSWKSETVVPGRRTGTEIILTEDGVLTVAKSGQKKTQTYKPGPDSMPEPVLDLALAHMLESNHKKIIVDTINADGRLVEVAISRMSPAHSATEHKFKVHFLDERRFSEEVYVDSRGRITRIQQDNSYRFDRTSAENIVAQFPEWADYILQRNKIFQ